MSRNKWIDDLDDLETPPEKESSSFSLAEWLSNLGQRTPYLPWIAAGVAGVLLVFGLTFFLGGEDEKPSSELSISSDRPSVSGSDVESLAARLAKLENKISSLTSQVEADSSGEPDHGLSETLQDLGLQLQNLENDFNRFKKQAAANFSSLQSKISSQPTSRSSSPSLRSDQAGSTVYTVKKGDNLYRIGLKFNVSVDQLRSWNGLSPSSEIYPGQELRIRAQ
jgi:LysM repeat protein